MTGPEPPTGTDAGVAERTESEHHAAYCEMVAAELDSGVRIWPSSAWFRCTAALLAQQATQLQEARKVTRFEVIDETGRVLVRRPVQVELSYQDDGRTLKVFLKASK